MNAWRRWRWMSRSSALEKCSPSSLDALELPLGSLLAPHDAPWSLWADLLDISSGSRVAGKTLSTSAWSGLVTAAKYDDDLELLRQRHELKCVAYSLKVWLHTHIPPALLGLESTWWLWKG